MFGFIKGVLSSQRGWRKPGDIQINNKDVYSVLSPEQCNTKIKESQLEDILLLSIPTFDYQEHDCICDNIITPSQYYLKRGFSPDTLNAFGVFDCYDKNSSMYCRATVPVYDANGLLVGYTGRSIYNWDIKWRHTESLPRNKVLYNLNNLIGSNYHTIILTEGPGKVWRLHEAGYPAIAIFGTAFTETQFYQLSKLGCSKILLMMDNDQAGNKASSIIYDQLKSLYNIAIPKISFTDIDETPTNIVQEALKNFYDSDNRICG